MQDVIWTVLTAGSLWEPRECDSVNDVHTGTHVSVSTPGPTWELPELLTALVPRETHWQ